METPNGILSLPIFDWPPSYCQLLSNRFRHAAIMPMPTRRPHFLILLTLLVLRCTWAFAQVDPDIDWKRMRLPHFDLIYDAQQQELAKIYAARLEGSYDLLTPLFPEPPSRISVVMDDRTDLTNGSATTFPYPLIMVYPVLPTPQDSIGEYKDWASELVTHESTHIYAMNPQRGAVNVLSYLFGSIMSPNILLPRWWHEGLAVENETRFSGAGRLRSPQEDAWLRSYVVDNRLSELTLAEANEVSIPTWPYGARPYILGSAMWSEMTAMKGTQPEKDLSWAYAGRMPYFINGPAEDSLGMNYQGLFDRTMKTIETRGKKQLSELKVVPPSKTSSVHLDEVESFSPTVSPDGLKLAFISKDETERRFLSVLQRPNRNVPFDASQLRNSFGTKFGEASSEMHAPVPHDTESDPPGGTITRLAWFPNSNKILFDKIEILNWFHETSDLYTYDLKTGKKDRLSYGLRAREPALSPSGANIAYIKVLPGKTNLEIMNVASKHSTVLFAAPLQARCSHPSFLNENEIVFSYRDNGVEKILRLNISAHTTHQILGEFPNANYPEMENGKFLFTSSKNGVHNLYASNEDLQTARPVSHSLTGVFESTWDPHRNEYYLTEQTSHGLKLLRVEKSEAQRLPANLPQVKPFFADRYPDHAPGLAANSTVSKAEVTDYSVWKYMLPRYWMPLFYWDSFSDYIAASTSAQDPLNKHMWAANVIYDLNYEHTGYNLSYQNNTTSAQIPLVYSDMTVTLPGVIPERIQYGHLEADWEITAWSPYWRAGPGWTWEARTLPGLTTTQSGPSLTAFYSDINQSGAQISPENGIGGSATWTYFIPQSNYLSYNQVELSIVKYWSSFLPKREALMAKFQSFIVDQNIADSNYAFTTSQALFYNTPYPQYLARAYPTGEFQGRVLNQATFEYRLPLNWLYYGWGTTPAFFKQLHGSIVADGANLIGFAYDLNSQVYRAVDLTRSFWGVGGELLLDTTIGYQFPITFYTGLYFPLERSLNPGPNIALGIYL